MNLGHQISNFKALTWQGQPFDLVQLKGKKIWLSFFRYASCPLCNLRVHEMISHYDKYKKLGLEIVAVFQSSPESMVQYVGKQNVPFHLLSDPSEHLYQQYGLRKGLSAFLSLKNLAPMRKAMKLGFRPGKMEGTITRIPGDFLINGEMTIEYIYYGKNIGDHIPFQKVNEFTVQ